MTIDSQFRTSIGLLGVWSAPPSYWSFSSLEEAITCPRRFALTRASYPQIWDKAGYPDRITEQALVGRVIHKAVETVLCKFRSAGCNSVSDALAIRVIRGLGGYTSIVTVGVNGALEGLNVNPRMDQQRVHLDVKLRRRIPEMRAAVQKLITRTSLVESVPDRNEGDGSRSIRPRSRISRGTHPEVTLFADDERFNGRVDLVTVREDCVDLLDFKSGGPVDRHSWQVTLYGLLWVSDQVANPGRLPIRSLTVVYPDRDLSVAVPTQWDDVRSQLVAEIARAEEGLAETPPSAYPSTDCYYCPVRHLCDEYWRSPYVQRDGRSSTFTDIEVLVRRRNGPRSWMARLIADSSEVLLRTSSEDDVFAPGQRLRILDIVVVESDDKDLRVATAVAGTEMYVVTDAAAPTTRES